MNSGEKSRECYRLRHGEAKDIVGRAAVYGVLIACLGFLFSNIFISYLYFLLKEWLSNNAIGEVVIVVFSLMPIQFVGCGLAWLVYLELSPSKVCLADKLKVYFKTGKPFLLRLQRWVCHSVLIYIMVLIVAQITYLIFLFFDLQIIVQPAMQLFSSLSSLLARCMLVFAILIVAPIFEEVLFRRIMPLAGLHLGFSMPWILSALCFAVLHGSLFVVPSLFAMALILNHVVRKYENLLDAIVIHAMYNLLSLLVFFFLY